jgi:hypothetical protein
MYITLHYSRQLYNTNYKTETLSDEWSERVFWAVKPCRLVCWHQCLAGTYCLHLHG